MPLFDFVCAGCRHQFEELVRSDDDTVLCPECGDAGVERQLPAFHASTGVPAVNPQACGTGCRCHP